jgi:hypothetical protein
MDVCVVLYSKSKRHKPGQSRQRNKYGKSTKREEEKELRKIILVEGGEIFLKRPDRP